MSASLIPNERYDWSGATGARPHRHAQHEKGRHDYIGLLDDLRIFVRRFVVVGERELDAIALWVLHTYVYDAATATPYLHPFSPEPGSGKTTLLEVLALVACDAVTADNLTEAVLFRMIEKLRPTLLFDEIDAVFGKRNSDSTEGIRQVLNSGYKKGKQAWRCVPPSHEIKAFDVFCPKATAGLHELPATLAHRSIPIAMQPPLPDDAFEDLDVEEVQDEAEILRRNLQSWADHIESSLRDPHLKPQKLPELDARGNEIWRILFRIADLAGGDWPGRARAAALELSGGDRRHEDTSVGVKLLAHIRDVFSDERIFCNALAKSLNALEDAPYGCWNDGRGISTRELGKKLSSYGIRAKTLRIGQDRAKGYERLQLAGAWSRYLPQFGAHNSDTVTTGLVEAKTVALEEGQDDVVTLSKEGASPHGHSDVTVVTVSEAGFDSLTPDAADPCPTCESREGVFPHNGRCRTCGTASS